MSLVLRKKFARHIPVNRIFLLSSGAVSRCWRHNKTASFQSTSCYYSTNCRKSNAGGQKIHGNRFLQKRTAQCPSKESPDGLRLIRSIEPETGKAIESLTDMRKHSAKFIAELYKNRWRGALFFKAVKQNLLFKKRVNYFYAVGLPEFRFLLIYPVCRRRARTCCGTR